MVDLSENQSDLIAKERAMADLSGKIQTMVHSEIILKESDNGTNYNSSASILTKNTVNVSVSGIEYIIHKDTTNNYALAYVKREDLSDYYRNKGSQILSEITTSITIAKELYNTGDSNKALEELYKTEIAFIHFFEQYSLFNSINNNNNFFTLLDSFNNLDEITNLELEISLLVNEIE
ncbi:MAG: hypothetical protein GY756_11850, partial [bacterium]|nr:hypothetical protein [bacterium]